MRIPVFVSCPTDLSPKQTACKELVTSQLHQMGLEERRLGKSDYPTDLPLREVFVLAQHCSGGVILGFEQFHANGGTRKRGTRCPKRIRGPINFPTPWNHLEAGILFALGLPLLVFRENGISDGIFDPGVSDIYIHRMPIPELRDEDRDALNALFLKWQASVRNHYYELRKIVLSR